MKKTVLYSIIILIVSCGTLQKKQVQTGSIHTSDRFTADSSAFSHIATRNETIYNATEDRFAVQPDSAGNIPTFKKTFNTGGASGTYGFDPDTGFFINLYTAQTADKNTVTETEKTSNTNTGETVTDTNWLIEQAEKTKGWSSFRWLTFFGTLILVFLAVWKLRALLLRLSWVQKILKT